VASGAAKAKGEELKARESRERRRGGAGGGGRRPAETAAAEEIVSIWHQCGVSSINIKPSARISVK
jgi:hypothetical protein